MSMVDARMVAQKSCLIVISVFPVNFSSWNRFLRIRYVYSMPSSVNGLRHRSLFQTCKFFMVIQKGAMSLDYSEIHASTAIAMFQYSMMSYLNRQNSDEISYGELFYRLLEEVQDAALFNA
ncbi:MAG: hypothetical protein JEY71_15550 [Sphaerochaeta sp.]|nr:hypothetical protein [Sphaerochaeta sp.]